MVTTVALTVSICLNVFQFLWFWLLMYVWHNEQKEKKK